MGRDRLASFHYRRELSRNADCAEALWNLGRLYFRSHRWLQASKTLRRCLDLGFMFEIEDTVDKLGFCYTKLGDLRSYIQIFTTYVRIFPRASWAFANLGRALLQAGDYRGAVLRLSRANKLGGTKSAATELSRAKKNAFEQSKRCRFLVSHTIA